MDLSQAVARGEDAVRGVRARELIATIDDAIADLTATRAKVTEAMIRAHRDVDDQVSGAATDEIRSSGHTDPTGRRAVRESGRSGPPDPVWATVSKLIDAVAASHAMATLARASALQLLPVSAEKAREMLGAGPGYCANCSVAVWRTGRSRLVAGRCRPCYEYRREHDGIERPRDLWTT